jgi:hypothetical protein
MTMPRESSWVSKKIKLRKNTLEEGSKKGVENVLHNNRRGCHIKYFSTSTGDRLRPGFCVAIEMLAFFL